MVVSGTTGESQILVHFVGSGATGEIHWVKDPEIREGGGEQGALVTCNRSPPAQSRRAGTRKSGRSSLLFDQSRMATPRSASIYMPEREAMKEDRGNLVRIFPEKKLLAESRR